MNPICKYWSHVHQTETDSSYCCARCGESWFEIEHRGDSGIVDRYWDFRWRIRAQYIALRHWLACPDCGKHFGRHDESVEHCLF